MSANDLREKLKQILSEDELRRVEVGTFHSIIGKLIRQNAVEIAYNQMFQSLMKTQPQQCIGQS